MNDYSTIRGMFQNWAEYKEVKLSENDLTILTFYAQEQYKKQNNGELLFKNYVGTNTEFNWDDLSFETGEFLVEVWNSYSQIINKEQIIEYMKYKENYNDIKELVR